MHFSLTDLAADITQNCAESGADLVELAIEEISPGPARQAGDVPSKAGGPVRQAGGVPSKAEFRFIARDNGKGMTGAELDRAMDPFVTDGVKHPGRKVGLGIPFLIQTALQSGGGWKISTVKAGECAVRGSKDSAASPGTGSVTGSAAGGNAGTVVEAWFDLANVDTPPVGDIPGLFRTVMLFSGPAEIVLKRKRQGGGDLDYEVKKTELEEVLGGLEDVSSLALLGKYLRSLEDE
ncbi:hypothetical protein AGMMS50230_01270 [Spirochaetia bacterium]|nr:hypothetical protein AGMMS50230_01270 [Spirochaetia bacterium]